MQRLRPQTRVALGLFALLLISACASLGITQPQSLDQRLAYTTGQITGIRSAAATAVESRAISADDGEKVLKMTDDAKALVDGAKTALAAGDQTAAESKLVLATSVLTALRTFLSRQS